MSKTLKTQMCDSLYNWVNASTGKDFEVAKQNYINSIRSDTDAKINALLSISEDDFNACIRSGFKVCPP